jgi:Zn-dependent M16 (insulinase) family peptidase
MKINTMQGMVTRFRNLAGMILCACFTIFLLTTCRKTDYHGFRLKDRQFVKEINAECLVFEHEKSGARLMKITNDDPNKTFCIAFRTFPESDDGSPHIMEHSVLNGSKNFPVKSPFDVLSKGSLSTFLNAFTSNDFTMYPVASMNEKDYFNLMHVYLDAVFNPLIYTDPRIMQQEGWHFEMNDPKGPLTYKGVVYNEMKGSFSDPQEELNYLVYRNLFPDNNYRFESGGYPAAIPQLSNAKFIDFHKKYYHPENSYIFVYGNGDLDKELAFIDSAYLSGYTKTGNQPSIEDQKPFPAMKEVSDQYPVMEGADMKGQSYLALDWVIGHSSDLTQTMSLDVLAEALVNQESAPIRLALQKAGIGQDVSASSSNLKQNVFEIVVRGANPGDQQKFREVVFSTLKEIEQKGLDKNDLEGIINRMEFRLREGDDAQKGLTYLMQSIQSWFFKDDPISGMRYEAPLAEVKRSLSSDYLEKFVRQHFLDNPHALLTSLDPKPGLESERNRQTESELAGIKATLPADSLERIIKASQDLLAYQQREDTPEALATIPLLKTSDIDPKAIWYDVKKDSMEGVPILFHETFTNNVNYIRYYFDMRVLPQELIPYGALLSNILGIMNTKNFSYAALTQALNRNTGGFDVSVGTQAVNLDDNQLIPLLTLSTKAMPDKLDKLWELSLEVLNNTRFDDPERLKTVLTRHQSQLEESVKSDGYSVAGRRAPSYFSKQGVFNQLTSGLDYYRFITEILKSKGTNYTEVTTNLQKTARLLFARENMVFAFTCDEKGAPDVRKGIKVLAAGLKSEKQALQTWNLEPVKKNEGLMAPSKVQYVVAGYDYKKLGYTWNGKMRVLSQVLSTDWLQQQIRVIGGAYGGWSSISPGGQMTFNSYRDPNLRETIDNYAGTVVYLEKFSAGETDMTRYIIGTIAGIDQPLTPSGEGDRAFGYYFTRRTAAEIQADRDAVLSTTADDIRKFAPMVKEVLGQKAWCVYGNAEKLKKDKDLFNSLVGLD